MARANLGNDFASIIETAEAGRDRVGNYFIDPLRAVEEAREFALDEHRKMHLRIGAPHRAHRGQTHDDIAKPVDGLDEHARGGGNDARGYRVIGGVVGGWLHLASYI